MANERIPSATARAFSDVQPMGPSVADGLEQTLVALNHDVTHAQMAHLQNLAAALDVDITNASLHAAYLRALDSTLGAAGSEPAIPTFTEDDGAAPGRPGSLPALLHPTTAREADDRP